MSPALRRAAVILGVAGVLLGIAGPASATPAPVSNVAYSLGAHGLVLTWTASGTGAPVVRDVTNVAAGGDPTTGRLVSPVGTAGCPIATCVYDTGFLNTGPATYAIWAADSDGTTSTPVTVDVAGPLPALDTAVTLATSATAVKSPGTFVLSGTVSRGGVPFPGAKVTLISRVLGSSTSGVLTYLTSATDGTVRFSYLPTRSRTYQLSFPGDAYSNPSTSEVKTVTVVPLVTAAYYKASTIEWKQVTTLRGGTSPRLPGTVLTIQRLVGTTWEYVTHVTLSSYSTWALPLSPAIGRYTYRAVLPATASYAIGISPSAVLTVVPRTLRVGVRGPDVLALEKRLTALHYDVGAIDGYFDYDLHHAVIAFEKVERLARTGEWRAEDRTRVLHPVGYSLRRRASGLAIEVDITRQVLVLSRSGVILRIIDVSTGSENVYYENGVRNIAHTPRGLFRIYFKVNGMRISPLGELWRPSFFYKGFAIHGNGSVPVYPASHGCVRITDSEANRLFWTFAIGTPVYIFDE